VHAARCPPLRLCYNSLGAYATVNHLHFQVSRKDRKIDGKRVPDGARRKKEGFRRMLCGESRGAICAGTFVAPAL
jgi:hypothetical protein